MIGMNKEGDGINQEVRWKRPELGGASGTAGIAREDTRSEARCEGPFSGEEAGMRQKKTDRSLGGRFFSAQFLATGVILKELKMHRRNVP
jgi:hypothetical protein